MSAAQLKLELKLRDGQKREISVQLLNNNLPALIGGLSELHLNAAPILSQLVEQEKGHGACALGDEEEEEEDGDEEDEEECELRLPAKRSRT